MTPDESKDRRLPYTEGPMPSLVLLGIASGLSPFGMAIVVPAMNSIASRFDADFTSLQYVISAYILGLAVAQPLCGFVSDSWGRRPVMLAGFTVFVVSSTVCAFADSLPTLVIARFFQAMGVSVGTVATRAILRDTRHGDDIAIAMSYIAVAMGLAPVIAPAAGGYLDTYTGYPAIFLVSAAIGCIVLFGMAWRLPETLPPGSPPPHWRQWLNGYRRLLRSPQFLGYTLIYGFVQGSFFAFLAIGAPLFLSAFGIASKTFGIIWGSMAVTYVIGAIAGARLTPVLGADRLMLLALAATVAAGLALLLAAIAPGLTPLRVLLPLGMLMALAGITTPGAIAGAVRPHPDMAGTASGLSSALGLVLNGLFTIVAGALYSGDFAVIAVLIFAACCLSAASYPLARANRAPRAGSRAPG